MNDTTTTTFSDEFVLSHSGRRYAATTALLWPHEDHLLGERLRQLPWSSAGAVLVAIAVGQQKALTEGPLTPEEVKRAVALNQAANDQYERLRPSY